MRLTLCITVKNAKFKPNTSTSLCADYPLFPLPIFLEVWLMICRSRHFQVKHKTEKANVSRIKIAMHYINKSMQ